MLKKTSPSHSADDSLQHIHMFHKTLRRMSIDGVYTKRFSPEQIYYQLESATDGQIEELAREVNKQYKRYQMDLESGRATKGDSEGSESSEFGGSFEDNGYAEDGIEADDYGQESYSLGDENDQESYSEGDENEYNQTIESPEEDNSEDGSDSQEVGSYISESEEELKDVDWESDFSSCDSVIIRPAGEVLEGLNAKDFSQWNSRKTPDS